MTATSPPPHTEEALVSETPRTLLQRLHAVMQDVAYVQKDKKITSYKVVTHDKVTATVRPILVKHGVFYYPHTIQREQTGKITAIDMVVRFVNVDDKADYLDVPTCGYGLDTGDKGPGKAMSYAVKYALLKALGLETGEDADNEASPDASQHEPQGQQVPKGPKGGKPKPVRSEKQIALEWNDRGEARAAVYPFTDWNNIRLFLDDLAIAVAADSRAWDTNINDIERVREKITDAAHAELIDKLQEVELQLEQQFLAAG